MKKVEKRIWDLPVRITHWGLVISFTGAYLTAEVEPLLIHEIFAYACLTLVVFRVMWGLIGSQTARFTQFVKGPDAVREYLSELLRFRHKEYWGHNPVGALAVLAILGLMVALVGAGLFAQHRDFLGPWADSVSLTTSRALQEVHEVLANVLLAVVLFHIGAILAYRIILRDNLIKPMVSGTRPAAPDFVEPKFAPIWLAAGVFAVSVAITGAVFRFWIF